MIHAQAPLTIYAGPAGDGNSRGIAGAVALGRSLAKVTETGAFADLTAAFDLLAQGPILGREIAEFEAAWPDGRPNPPERLIESLAPFLRALKG